MSHLTLKSSKQCPCFQAKSTCSSHSSSNKNSNGSSSIVSVMVLRIETMLKKNVVKQLCHGLDGKSQQSPFSTSSNTTAGVLSIQTRHEMVIRKLTLRMPMAFRATMKAVFRTNMQAMLRLAVTDRQTGSPRLGPMTRLLCAMAITAHPDVQRSVGLRPFLAR